jgi:ribonuclease BN (tRNA processing enzyme)
LKVTCIRQTHPGDSYGYRFEKNGKAVVYSTDSEYRNAVIDDGHPMLGFFKDADLLVFDAQYELLDAVGVKSDWGHSSNVIGVELALRARAKRLCLFHNDPTFDDARLDDILADTRAYQEIAGGSSSNSGAAAAGVGEGEGGMLIDIAYDGLEIEL